MEQKKKTRGQLEREISTAIVLVPKTKGTNSIYFSDKGIRLTVTDDYCVISTMYHRHVFDKLTFGGVMDGFSRPYVYTKKIIDIAHDNINEITTKNGYSYAKLKKVLEERKGQALYNVVVYYEWYLMNIFQPLYSIGESIVDNFLVFEAYIHNMARNEILLNEKTEDMTTTAFLEAISEKEKEFRSDMQELVLFPKKTDEEVVKESIKAATEQMFDSENVAKENDGEDKD